VGVAAVTGITHRLSARGLIRRAVDDHDRRRLRLRGAESLDFSR
jgi:DNA-binding MarR family transcriptional regulator